MQPRSTEQVKCFISSALHNFSPIAKKVPGSMFWNYGNIVQRTQTSLEEYSLAVLLITTESSAVS